MNRRFVNAYNAWTDSEVQMLIRAVDNFQNVKRVAMFLGRSEGAIMARLLKMLDIRYFSSTDQLIQLFRNKFRPSPGDSDVNDIPDSKGPAKYRIVMDHKTKAVAETAEEAEAKATSLLRQNPTKDVFVFMAIKRFFVPTTVSSEDVP